MTIFTKDDLITIYIKHKIKIRFLLVGVWNTLFGFGLFVVLYFLFKKIFKLDYFAYTSSQILSTILAIINAYICHKFFTYQSKAKGRKMIFEFFRFTTTYVVVFFLGLIVMPFLVEILKLNPIVANLLFNIVVISSSYFGHTYFSFK